MRFYILYDGRACGGAGTDKANVLVAIGEKIGRHSAIREAQSYDFGECALYSYDMGGDVLADERHETDLS